MPRQEALSKPNNSLSCIDYTTIYGGDRAIPACVTGVHGILSTIAVSAVLMMCSGSPPVHSKTFFALVLLLYNSSTLVYDAHVLCLFCNNSTSQSEVKTQQLLYTGKYVRITISLKTLKAKLHQQHVQLAEGVRVLKKRASVKDYRSRFRNNSV